MTGVLLLDVVVKRLVLVAVVERVMREDELVDVLEVVVVV